MLNYALSFLLPLIAFASLSSTETYTREDIKPPLSVNIPSIEVNSLPRGTEQATEPPKKENIYTSCVRATQEIYPQIPLQDAIEFKRNGTMENGEMILMQYKSKTSDGYTYHIAPYKLGTSTIHIYNEGNYIAGEKTERDIPFDDPAIIGFFDYDLWLKIKALPQSAQDTIKCESHFEHYAKDGSVKIGPTQDYGLGQFTRKTWNWFNTLRAKQGLPKLYDIFDPYQQVEMIAWAWTNNLQSHWVCYNKLNSSP